tara:strand:+ start:1396 stop:3078 length:1683 start_codon:yes stop_codon:yes gene_type:complete
MTSSEISDLVCDTFNPFSDELSSKFTVMYLAAQSGKTKLCIELMELWQKSSHFDFDTFSHCPIININIWMSANNQQLEGQTEGRLNEQTFINALKWDSTEKKTVEEVNRLLMKEEYNTVVCCTNPFSIKKIKTLICQLQEDNDEGLFRKIPKINIFIDEADATIKSWHSLSNVCEELDIVDNITLITATGIEKLVNIFPNLPIYGYDKTFSNDSYHSCKDSIPRYHEKRLSPGDYAINVMETYPSILRPGVCGYMPGGKKQITHYQIANFLLSKNCAVFVINGRHKELRLPNGAAPIPFTKGKQIGENISEIYIKYDLCNYFVGIVGLTCTGRGITLHSPILPLRFAIISYIRSKNEAYQTVARMNGHIKKHDNYRPPVVFCQQKQWKNILEKESIAIHLSKIAYEKNNSTREIIKNEDILRAKTSTDRKFMFFRGKDAAEQAYEFVKNILKPKKPMLMPGINSNAKHPTICNGSEHARKYDNQEKTLRNWTEEEYMIRPTLRNREQYRAHPSHIYEDGDSWAVWWNPNYFNTLEQDEINSYLEHQPTQTPNKKKYHEVL